MVVSRSLSKTSCFTDNLISIIFDEAHCISAWGAFRPEYKDVGCLRFMLPRHIPILITSATLPPLVLDDVKSILQLRNDKLVIFRRSSDWPNIHIFICSIINSLSSFTDLEFIIHNWKPGCPPPPKFLIFFDDINEIEPSVSKDWKKSKIESH